MTLLSFLLRKSRISIVVLVLIAGLVAGASNAGLLAIINTALANVASHTAFEIWGFIALCLLMLGGRLASQIMLVRLSQGTLFEMRMQLSRQILLSPLRLLEETGKPRLMAALTEDLFAINAAIVTIPQLCMQIATVIGGLVYLGWLNPVILLWTVVFMVVGAASYKVPMMRVSRYMKLGREHGILLLKHFRTLTEGTKELKLHRSRREAFLTTQLRSAASSFHRNSFMANTTANVAASWGQLLFFIAIGLLIFAFPAFRPISVKSLTGYTLTILYLMNPLQYILDTFPVLNRAQISLKKVQEIGLLLSKSPEEASAVETPEPVWKSLEMAGVMHSYAGERNENFMLGPVDLTLHPGELLFITGGNGSGKTTLAKILVGLYAPEAGSIRLNGELIDDRTREDYRQLFSVVFSDFHLFDSLLGLDAPELDAQASQYLAELRLDHKVQIEKGVFSTTDLSQGQRKRLALLTAYLEDRPIYVFDEWAADQDPLFKEVFYYQLLPDLKARGKTVVVISHDDRYYSVADRLIKLDYGKIVTDARPGNSEQTLCDASIEEEARVLQLELQA